VSPDGMVSTIAGSREQEDGFADGAAAGARFHSPHGVAVDAEGSIIVADVWNYCIRKVSPDGTVSTIAGSREQEYGFADGAAADARFHAPTGVAIDAEGSIIVADDENHCIRKVTSAGLDRGLALPQFVPAGPPTITADLRCLLGDEIFADATFDVGGARITAHRNILAARSDYFRSMFTSSCREAQPDAVIGVHGTTAEAFQRVLAFLYTDQLQLDEAVVIDVLCKAEEYGVTRAARLCMRYCVQQMCPSNAVNWLVRADSCHLDDLRRVALAYVQQHFRRIRTQARGTLAALREHPDLLLEVMDRV